MNDRVAATFARNARMRTVQITPDEYEKKQPQPAPDKDRTDPGPLKTPGGV